MSGAVNSFYEDDEPVVDVIAAWRQVNSQMDNEAFVDGVSDENLRDALRAAAENVTILEGIRDKLNVELDRSRLELQRLRERSSVEAAEARVQYARLQRSHNELALKANRLEADCNTLRLEVYQLQAGRKDFINTLMGLAQAYSQTAHGQTSEA